MPVEGFIGFPMAVTQNFNFFHLPVIFFRAGKKIQQPVFKNIIRLRCF